jgi:hypothetical protein
MKTRTNRSPPRGCQLGPTSSIRALQWTAWMIVASRPRLTPCDVRAAVHSNCGIAGARKSQRGSRSAEVAARAFVPADLWGRAKIAESSAGGSRSAEVAARAFVSADLRGELQDWGIAGGRKSQRGSRSACFRPGGLRGELKN